MIILDLFEARTPLIEKLRIHSHDPKIFVTFTDVLKIGINPQTTWNEPLGIFAYPLKEMFEDFETKIIPFAGDRKFAYILRSAGNLLELDSTYQIGDLDRDLEKLQKNLWAGLMTPPPHTEISDPQAHWEANLMSWYERWSGCPPAAFWMITSRIANYLENRFPQRDSRMIWNSMLRQLGYDGVCDRGEGYIYATEPAQAVFLRSTAVQVIEACPNDLLKIA